jgi:regulatory protein
MIAQKMYHSAELRAALLKRLIPEESITAIVKELTDLGYLDDSEWTASFIRGQQRKGKGPRAIQHKLRQRGIAYEHLNEDLTNPEKQREQLAALLNTKYKTRNLKDPKERAKVMTSLARRGFHTEQIFISMQGVDF